MKRIFLFTALFFSLFANGQTAFQEVMPVIYSTQYSSVSNIALTSDGGFIFCNTFDETLSWGSKITKTDSTGQIQWVRSITYDTASSWVVMTVGECPGGYFVVGQFVGNSHEYGGNYLTKLNPTGNILWSKVFTNDINGGITSTVFPESNGDFLISNSGCSGVIKLDANGNVIFNKTYSTNLSTCMETVGSAIGTDGGFAICGGLPPNAIGIIKTDPSGNIQWAKNYGDSTYTAAYFPTDITATADGGFVIVGQLGNNSASFLFKVNANGNLIWQKDFSNGFIDKIIEKTDKELIGTVFFNWSHLMLVSFDSTGNYTDGESIGPAYSTNSGYNELAIRPTPDNGIVTTGLFLSPNGNGIFLFKSDSSIQEGCTSNHILLNNITSSLPPFQIIPTTFYQANTIASTRSLYPLFISNIQPPSDFCSFLSVNENKLNTSSMTLYPSPIATGENITITISEFNGKAEISIYDVTGKIVQQQQHDFIPGENFSMATKNLQSGIYLMRIEGIDGENVASTKFVVK